MIPENTLSSMLRKALSTGAEYADVFVESKEQHSIQLEDDKIEKVLTGTDSGVGVRTLFNSKTAYAYSNDFSEENLIDLSRTVASATDGKKEDVVIDLKSTKPDVTFSIEKDPSAVEMDKKTALLLKANEVARKVDKRIRQVTVIYRDMIQKVFIANSDGTFAEDDRIYMLFVINVIAADGDIIQTGYETAGGNIGFELFDSTNVETMALNAAERAVRMLEAEHAPAGRMPVVISSEAGGTMIHEAIGHGLEADLAQQGLSVYSGQLEKQIASPLVTVIDDATIPTKRGSFRFDDEGTPSQKTVLVENGILKGYMYDRLTSMNDNTRSTANGRRESYHSKPIPRMTNTYLASGSSYPNEIIKNTEKGLFVKKMGGGQVNTVSGEFVFDVQEGFLIENGSVGKLIRGATLTGNGPEILRSIDMVGSDLGFAIGTCGKDAQGVPVSDAMPTVRLPDIVVGGKV
ncbi:MAG: TldD/PmbA family protein [Thermodesulfovibrionales bacterium]